MFHKFHQEKEFVKKEKTCRLANVRKVTTNGSIGLRATDETISNRVNCVEYMSNKDLLEVRNVVDCKCMSRTSTICRERRFHFSFSFRALSTITVNNCRACNATNVRRRRFRTTKKDLLYCIEQV